MASGGDVGWDTESDDVPVNIWATKLDFFFLLLLPFFRGNHNSVCVCWGQEGVLKGWENMGSECD